MSAPARNTREVRRRPRRAAALARARVSRQGAMAVAEEIRAQLIAAGREPNPRPTGRELLRWASERGISVRILLPEFMRSKDAAYVDQPPKDADDESASASLYHLITAPRTGPPAVAAAVGIALPDCTGGAVIVL
jgi:hypothetical protein